MDRSFKQKSADIAKKELDLQKRIINIMNRDSPPTFLANGKDMGVNQRMPDIEASLRRTNLFQDGNCILITAQKVYRKTNVSL